jgi:hypothetical protein
LAQLLRDPSVLEARDVAISGASEQGVLDYLRSRFGQYAPNTLRAAAHEIYQAAQAGAAFNDLPPNFGLDNPQIPVNPNLSGQFKFLIIARFRDPLTRATEQETQSIFYGEQPSHEQLEQTAMKLLFKRLREQHRTQRLRDLASMEQLGVQVLYLERG